MTIIDNCIRILLISTDQGLINTLQNVQSKEILIEFTDDFEMASFMRETREFNVLIVDGDLEDSIPQLIEFQMRFPELITIVIAHLENISKIAAISTITIGRLIKKPASIEQIQIALNIIKNKIQKFERGQTQSIDATETPDYQPSTNTGISIFGNKKYVAGLSGIIILAIISALFFNNQEQKETTIRTPQDSIEPSEKIEVVTITPIAEPTYITEKISEQTIITSTHKTDLSESQQVDAAFTKTDPLNDLLEKAQLALNEYQYTKSRNENATSLYQQVLALDPDNVIAKTGMESLFDIMLARVQTGIDNKHFQDAKITLKKATDIKPDHKKVQTLNSKLVTTWAQDIVNVAQKDTKNGNYASALFRLNAFLKDYPDNLTIIKSQKLIQQQQKDSKYFIRLLKLIHERIEQDALISPVDDNAKHYIFKARTIKKDNKKLAKITNDLQTLFLIKVRNYIANKKFEDAAKWLNEAKLFMPDDKQTHYVATELETAEKQAKEEIISTLLKEAEQRIANKDFVLPKNDSAKY